MTPMAQFEVKPLVPLHLGSWDISFTNQAAWMFAVVGAAALFYWVAGMRRTLVPGRLQSIAELSYEFVDDMIRSAAGEGGLKFFSFVFTIFLFVLLCNMFGLIPGSFSVTGQIAITFALALLVILAVIVTGFIIHGLGFLKLFVPKAPLALLPPLVVIEVISFFTRLISLSVRLFANMLGGHTLLKVFAAFIVTLGATAVTPKFWLAPISVAPLFFEIAVYALEFLVALLQAYVFAILTCIYLNEALHLHDSH